MLDCVFFVETFFVAIICNCIWGYYASLAWHISLDCSCHLWKVHKKLLVCWPPWILLIARWTNQRGKTTLLSLTLSCKFLYLYRSSSLPLRTDLEGASALYSRLIVFLEQLLVCSKVVYWNDLFKNFLPCFCFFFFNFIACYSKSSLQQPPFYIGRKNPLLGDIQEGQQISPYPGRGYIQSYLWSPLEGLLPSSSPSDQSGDTTMVWKLSSLIWNPSKESMPYLH